MQPLYIKGCIFYNYLLIFHSLYQTLKEVTLIFLNWQNLTADT